MKIRSTEREHSFTKKLFTALQSFSLQGLTLSISKEFTAAIEAIQYEENEVIDISKVFPLVEVKAKYYLAKILNVPLYFVIYQKELFTVYQVTAENEFSSERILELDELKFIKWWAELKGLRQPKPLMEASERVKDSIFDNTLEKHMMAWGGNIDGYIFKNKTFACIIENIYTNKNPLESPRGEPSPYFHLRGPNYNTWYPTVKLAALLKIPLFLFTMEGLNDKERIGFTVIEYLAQDGIHYLNNIYPNKNIIEGIENIQKTLETNLIAAPPFIKD